VPQSLTPKRFFRVVAVSEAVTWTLLIAAMVVKYGLDGGDLPVRVAGSVHGFVFLAYAATVVVVALNQRWSARLAVLGVVTAVVPYATVPFDVGVDRRGLLDGPWRTTATDDPRDHTVVGRLLRWMLVHPLVLVTVLLVGVAAVMSVLLVLGPPSEWGAQAS
jgi:integral membrane protein